MDLRTAAQTMAAGRMVLGAGLVVAPALTGRLWFGRSGGSPAARALAVTMGARDLALGAGTAHAAQTGAPLRPWLLASVVGDAADLAVTQRHRAVVPWPTRVGVSLLAAGAALAGVWLARHAEDVTPEAIITPR